LVFATDTSGWWNLHRWHPDRSTEAITDLDGAEIGGPAWAFGSQPWVEYAPGQLAVVVTEQATDRLATVALGPPGRGPKAPEPITPPPSGVHFGALAATGDGRVGVITAGPRSLPELVIVAPLADGPAGADSTVPPPVVVRPSEDTGVDSAWFSTAQAISFDSGPPEARRRSHAFFYPPTAPGLVGPDGSAPPLVVVGHGGPTAHNGPNLNLKIQYWTSRGFAVADVNYGGSSGYGRDYRALLDRSWGVVDVEDCIAVAGHLAEQGLVDPDRMVIRGSSAGGLTVLAALQQSDRFTAGTSLYGVADLTALAADTHKFESRYLDGLVGPYPEQADIYRERSPINHTDRLSSPLLVLQGTEDEIVPPSQSEAIVAAVASKGLPHAYVTFEGEQHGFRRFENIVRSFEVELWFYGRVLGFDPADPIEAPEGAVGFGP
jgi:dipeptidyl aminopeptidase/acylaminoacyl peptidase